jgi:hypothetical protein
MLVNVSDRVGIDASESTTFGNFFPDHEEDLCKVFLITKSKKNGDPFSVLNREYSPWLKQQSRHVECRIS